MPATPERNKPDPANEPQHDAYGDDIRIRVGDDARNIAAGKSISQTDTGGGAYISGSVYTKGGAFIGRDLIQMIMQTARSQAEEARQAHQLEREFLAEGIERYAKGLLYQIERSEDSIAPFRGLWPYQLNDADHFFGRDRDIAGITENLETRFSVLTSESGAGKTSLLNAGLAPTLLLNQNLVVFMRRYDYVAPLHVQLKRLFVPNLDETQGLITKSLSGFLHDVIDLAGLSGRLFIFLDQFEEFFSERIRDTQRQKFVIQLDECLADPSLRVHWLISMREDSLAKLHILRTVVPNPINNWYPLQRLSRADVIDVLTGALQNRPAHFSEDLVKQMLDDLDSDSAGYVHPTQIQLVAREVYQNFRRQTLPEETDEPRTIGRHVYDELGGAETILRNHLRTIVDRTFPSGTDRKLARNILIALISSDQERLHLTLPDLQRALPAETNTDAVVRVLQSLVGERLILTNQEPDGPNALYELAHDYLLQELEVQPEILARKAAQELLARELYDYETHGTLLTAEKLAIIDGQRDYISLSDDAAAVDFVARSEAEIRSARNRTIRNLTIIAIILFGALILAVVFGLRANEQQRIAEDERQNTEHALATATVSQGKAESEANHARAGELAAMSRLALDDSNTQLAGLLGIESIKRMQSAIAYDTLVDVASLLPTKVLKTPAGDYPIVSTVAISSDSKWLATAEIGEVHVWDTTTTIRDKTIEANSFIHGMEFTEDDTHLVLWGRDWITVVDIENDWVVESLPAPTHDDDTSLTLEEVRMEPFGSTLTAKYAVTSGGVTAIGMDDYSQIVQVWDIANGKRITETRTDHRLEFFAYHPADLYLITQDISNTIQFDDSMTDASSELIGHVLKASIDNSILINLGKDMIAVVDSKLCSTQFFSLSNGWDPVGQISGFCGRSRYSRLSPNKQYFVGVSTSREFGTFVQIWDVVNGTQLSHLSFDAPLHDLEISPDSRRLATAAGDTGMLGIVNVWNMQSGTLDSTIVHDEWVRDIDFSSDSELLATSSYDGHAYIWLLDETRTSPSIHSVPIFHTFSDTGSYVNVSSDGSMFLTERGIWNFAEGSRLEDVDPGIHGRLSPMQTWLAVTSEETLTLYKWGELPERIGQMEIGDYGWLEFSPNDRFMVLAWQIAPLALVIDTETETLSGQWLDHEFNIVDIAISSSSELLATLERGSNSEAISRIHVWNLNDSTLRQTIELDTVAWAIDFDVAGCLLAVALNDDSVEFWDACSKDRVDVLITDLGANDIRFLGYGKSIAIQGRPGFSPLDEDRTDVISIWDYDVHLERARLDHDSHIQGWKISHDGQWIATAEQSGVIHIWSTATGEELARTHLQSYAPSYTIAYVPNSKTLLIGIGGSDNTLVWDWNPESIVNVVCQRLSRNFTHDEWMTYFPNEFYNKTCPNIDE